MSLTRPILNTWLRLTEKPHLARAKTPEVLRRSLEIKARLSFRAPRGSRFRCDTLEGVAVEWVSGPDVRDEDAPLVLYFHGGGYIFGSSRTHRAMLAQISALTGLPCCLPSYSKAPEDPFPRALEEVLRIYQALSDRPGGLVLGGDSAGGGMALAVLAEVLRRGWEKPVGVFAFSPVTDLAFTGESIARNAKRDVMLPAFRAGELAGMYLNGHDPRDPRASPLYADFTGAPPVWVAAGDTEILLDDTRRIAELLRQTGADVQEVIEHDLPHVWPLFHNLLPEARATLRALARWITDLSPRQGDS